MKPVTFIILTLCTLTGCRNLNQATRLAPQFHQDSTYRRQIQYDSIYIYRDRYLNKGRDTVYLRETEIEYRYKLLRDTIHIIQRDSIPYPVTIVETQKVRYIPRWSKVLSFIGVLSTAFLVLNLTLKR